MLAFPPILSPEEAAQFNQTLAPYVFSSQILELPARVAEAGTDLQSLLEVYLATNPMLTAIAFALAISPLFVLAAEIRRNYSQVDCWWSILPTIYNVHFYVWALLNGLPTDRLQTVGLFSIAWSIRLTFNYWRKGGYGWGAEDYRWPILREWINNRFLFFVFDVVFIAFTQSLLLCLITAPTYIFALLAQLPETPAFDVADLVFSRLLIFYILIEIVADEQQWRYQQAKYTFKDSGVVTEGYDKEDLERGFVVSGLWSLVRHPNFAAEQAIWLTLYAWSAYRTHTYANWAGVGTFGYLALFQGSTWLTEKLSAGKYPEYTEYQARVGKFIPRWSVTAKGPTAKNEKPKPDVKKEE
ncbi:hypothetical protein UA08_04241 [Talaromyces atroroseus]|uniref:Steroid 5-alpha reductase C-terminal domain-containing protein n=1 Tax=Talaromyces atroroseus TaxID=1441469 RepID=A0A1Q5Q9J5_TALAT|nr:hypothetical protein UA08_04241 [Talaromyces atroroseus]OKL60742.1 hypothetical protein UA08_04241 [Talaromyces atroroseus]